MILKSAFIIARVEILTRIAKYFFGMRTIIFNCNYFHRKLFVVKISSIIIPMLKSRNLQFVFNEYYPIYNFHYCRKASISKEAACVRRSHINLLRETKKRGKRRDDGWLLTQLRACDPRPTIFYSRATSDSRVSSRGDKLKWYKKHVSRENSQKRPAINHLYTSGRFVGGK